MEFALGRGMQAITSYRDLEAWQLGMDFAEAVYALHARFHECASGKSPAAFLAPDARLEWERRTLQSDLRTRERAASAGGEPTNPEPRIPV
jgi:hypothetical protein